MVRSLHRHSVKPCDTIVAACASMAKKVPMKRAPMKARRKRRGSAAKRQASREVMNRPVKLSAELAEVVGSQALSRPEAVKQLWAYCKKKRLLNPKDKREILCDARLKKLLGAKSTTMFGLSRLLVPHFDFSGEVDEAEDSDDDGGEEEEAFDEGRDVRNEQSTQSARMTTGSVKPEDVAHALSQPPCKWSPREVHQWCKSIHVPILAQKVKEYAVDGPTLLSFTEEDLQGIGISTPFIVRRVVSALKGLGGG